VAESQCWGVNPVAVELAAVPDANRLEPTVDAANETAGRGGGEHGKLPFWAKIQLELEATGINFAAHQGDLMDSGKLNAQTRTCLELIKKIRT